MRRVGPRAQIFATKPLKFRISSAQLVASARVSRVVVLEARQHFAELLPDVPCCSPIVSYVPLVCTVLLCMAVDIVPHGRWLPGAGSMCSADLAGIMLERLGISNSKKDQQQQKRISNSKKVHNQYVELSKIDIC